MRRNSADRRHLLAKQLWWRSRETAGTHSVQLPTFKKYASSCRPDGRQCSPSRQENYQTMEANVPSESQNPAFETEASKIQGVAPPPNRCSFREYLLICKADERRLAALDLDDGCTPPIKELCLKLSEDVGYPDPTSMYELIGIAWHIENIDSIGNTERQPNYINAAEFLWESYTVYLHELTRPPMRLRELTTTNSVQLSALSDQRPRIPKRRHTHKGGRRCSW
jgi:hypothetical protein